MNIDNNENGSLQTDSEISVNKENIKTTKTVKLSKVIAILISTVLITVAATAVTLYIVFNGNGSFSKTAMKLRELDKLVSENYNGNIDYSVIDNAVMKAYVDSLDDNYSFYKNSDSSQSVSDSFKGESNGIGVSVVYDSTAKNIYICNVYENSPAEKAGLLSGDRITAVDGQTIEKLGYKKAVSSIKKENGKSVEISVLRNNKALNITAVCGEFKEQTVFYHMINSVGYIKITEFNSATVNQFKNALDFINKQKATAITFDLRNNGGGTVDSAAEIIDKLIGECNIVSVQYKNGEKKVLYKSDKNKVELPMTVIVNGDTASAAELFTAALRDEANAKIIGEKTYGKGVMQSTYFFSDKSCVRFTIAKFLPPCGVCFDGEGITPDISVSYTDEQQKIYYMLTDNDDPFITAAIKSSEESVK